MSFRALAFYLSACIVLPCCVLLCLASACLFLCFVLAYVALPDLQCLVSNYLAFLRHVLPDFSLPYLVFLAPALLCLALLCFA